MTKRDTKDRSFSVELNSRANLKNIRMANGSPEPVLIEGTIGALHHARFLEGVILEVVGNCGAIRIDLRRQEIRSINTSMHKKETIRSEKGAKTL